MLRCESQLKGNGLQSKFPVLAPDKVFEHAQKITGASGGTFALRQSMWITHLDLAT